VRVDSYDSRASFNGGDNDDIGANMSDEEEEDDQREVERALAKDIMI
jgi:hypothetical protein